MLGLMKKLLGAFKALTQYVLVGLGVQSKFLQELNLIQHTQRGAPFPVQPLTCEWPIKEDFQDTTPPAASSRFPYTSQAHLGIANSKWVSMDVVNLRVYGREFRRYVRTQSSEIHAAIELVNSFPNLQCLLLDDDYLSDREQQEIEAILRPLSVSWTRSLYIDGRHGR
jgi:hypothetical protein